MGNNIFFLQRDIAVSDESPPFPGQLAYTPDNGFHPFSFEQQPKVLPGFVSPVCFTKRGFYASPGVDAVLNQTEMNLGEMSVYTGSHFIKPVRLRPSYEQTHFTFIRKKKQHWVCVLLKFYGRYDDMMTV